VCAADNCDFYPAYAGFDYFAGVHHGTAADFLSPPPPPPGVPVSSGPHHGGGAPQPSAVLGTEHVPPRKFSSSSSLYMLRNVVKHELLDKSKRPERRRHTDSALT